MSGIWIADIHVEQVMDGLMLKGAGASDESYQRRIGIVEADPLWNGVCGRDEDHERHGREHAGACLDLVEPPFEERRLPGMVVSQNWSVPHTQTSRSDHVEVVSKPVIIGSGVVGKRAVIATPGESKNKNNNPEHA